jgi:hypothetical protein
MISEGTTHPWLNIEAMVIRRNPDPPVLTCLRSSLRPTQKTLTFRGQSQIQFSAAVDDDHKHDDQDAIGHAGQMTSRKVGQSHRNFGR